MSAIKVGDLVVVIKPRECCPERSNLGFIFRVAKITHGEVYCCYCKRDHKDIMTAVWADDGVSGASLPRLKRIPPLDELEGEKRDEEITA